jgi:surface protein
MAYPVLAANSSWFTQGGTAVARSSITEIEIVDSYTPDSSVVVTDSWDASSAKDNSIMCYVIDAKLIIAGNGSGKIMTNADADYLFHDSGRRYTFSNVTKFNGLQFLDTSSATSMQRAFYGFQALESLDVSHFDMSHVTDIIYFFGNCKELKNVDVSRWDTKNLTRMYAPFYGCSKLEEVDVTNWDVSGCTLITFGQNAGLKSVGDLSNWDTSNCKMFQNAFSTLSALVTIGDLSNWDTSKAESMSSMFEGCSSLSYIGDLSNWNISSCVTMASMFSECTNLNGLDVSAWDTTACTDMSFMFYGCSSLGEIDVSNWDTSNVTNIDHFAAHANLKRKGMEKWNTSSLVNANAAFHNCAEEELDLSGWDVSKNQFFCQMFENSPNLKRIKGLDRWDTSAGLGFDGMFERCYKLEEVDLSSFNTTKAKNGTKASTNDHTTATLQNMFLSCNNLKKVKLGPNFSINGDGTNTTTGNKLILPTPSTDYITGADGNWYAFNGDPYAPNAIQDKTAETYFASFPLCQNEDVIVKNGSLIDVAKAIKEKNGATDKYTPAQFGAAIRAL